MTYLEARDAFESTPQFSSTATLSRIKLLLELLGHPEQHLKYIHVAGTNGKGSTSTMTARVLEEHGFKTGLFLSPYVVDFRERISVSGVLISEAEFSDIASRVLFAAEKISDTPNFFELITAAALLYFKEQNCDFAVLEVGMGGRLDATNAIPAPLVAAITPISLDHTAYLGNTTGAIAFEKTGIIKPGCIAVSAASQPEDAQHAVIEACRQVDVPLLIPKAAKNRTVSLSGTSFTYCGETYSLKLLGEHQIDNACMVLEVCEALKAQGITLYTESIQSGLRKATLPARLELLSSEPLCVLDGSHNPAGIATLFSFLRNSQVLGKRITVFGCLRDKGYDKMCEAVAASSDIVITTRCPSPRSATAQDLAPYLTACPKHYDIPDLYEALKKAHELSTNDDLIAICGSLYLASSVKQITI